MRKRTVSIILALILASTAMFVTLPGMANAQSAVRTLPASVAPSTNFDVGMTASDYGAFGQIVETVPGGCAYVGSSLPAYQVDASGFPEIRFTLFGDTAFTYTLTSPAAAGGHTFSGILKDDDEPPNEYPVTGDIDIVVGAPPELQADADGPYAGVVDTVVNFFGSASGGTPPYDYEWDFDYDGIFTADEKGESVSNVYGEAGEYMIALRVIDDISKEDIDITTVEISDVSSAYRILLSSAYPGGNCAVLLDISNYGTSGEITEQFPDGFFYINSSLTESFLLENNTVRFILSGESVFTYYLEVLVPPGVYNFHGTLKDENGEEFIIKGDYNITVEEHPLTVDIDDHYRGQVNQDICISPFVMGGFPPYVVQWDLNNDGVYETMGKNISYSWDDTGNYTVGLRVVDDANTTVTVALSVTVYEKQKIKNITWLLIVVLIICCVLILLFLKYRYR